MTTIASALEALYSPPAQASLPTVRWVPPVAWSPPESCAAAQPSAPVAANEAATPAAASPPRRPPKRSNEPKRPSQRGHIKVAWSKHEDQIILNGVRCYGLKWSKIVGLLVAAEYSARTDDAVRNRWQRLVRKQQAAAAARAEAELEAADAASNSSSADAPPASNSSADAIAPMPPLARSTLAHEHVLGLAGGMAPEDGFSSTDLSMPLLENPEEDAGGGALLAPTWALQLGLSELPGAAPHGPTGHVAPPPAAVAAAATAAAAAAAAALGAVNNPTNLGAAPASALGMDEAVEGRGGDMWTAEEDRTIDEGVRLDGLRWREVAERLPGRTASGCRNRWVRTQERNFAAGGRTVRGAVAVFAALRAEGRINKRHKWERRREALGAADLVMLP